MSTGDTVGGAGGLGGFCVCVCVCVSTVYSDILRCLFEPGGNLHFVNKCEWGEKVIGQARLS